MWRNRHLVCHLFSCMVTKLLCHVRGSCSLFQELMWDTEKRAHPSTSILPAKDHSKYVYGTQLFVISPLVQFLSLFSAASCDSGKLCFPLRNKCQWISTIIFYSVVFALHALSSLCSMSQMIQQFGPKFRNKQRLLKGLLRGRKWTKALCVRRENK